MGNVCHTCVICVKNEYWARQVVIASDVRQLIIGEWGKNDKTKITNFEIERKKIDVDLFQNDFSPKRKKSHLYRHIRPDLN
jgi:hypothetical protein